jgi:hypothetical protein
MKLILNLEILVALGRFLPLCCYVLQNHFVRYVTAARCKVPLGFDLPAGNTIEKAKEIAQFLEENIATVSYTKLY